MKVLVAADNLIIRFLIADLVQEWSHEVVTASDGLQAWEALCVFDGLRIAILDWAMPKLDGVEICRRIKSKPDAPFVYVMLLAARTENKGSALALDAGSNDFLLKPVHSTELKRKLNIAIIILNKKQTPI